MRFRGLQPRSDGAGRGIARVLLALAFASGVWAVLATITGGFRFEVAGVTISSRNPFRPAVAAVLLAIVAWLFERRQVESIAGESLATLSDASKRFAAPLAALTLLIVGLQFGARAASGADESGYVSQAALWLRGELRIDLPLAASVPWPEAVWTFTPLGYRPIDDHRVVPTYAPGLPLLMAGARLISACAPFFIVPICGALLVLFAWLLGRRIVGDAPAASGAVMLAVSPVVVLMSMAPMTDVPVATFWIAALYAADLATVRSAAAAGALAGIAAVVRPNLAPLALFPLLLTMVHGGARRTVLTRGAVLSLAVAPSALFIAVLHNSLYGSPFTSGYGDAASIYALKNFPDNLVLYPSWWWEAHGVIGWLFVIGIFRPRPAATRRRAWVLAAFAAAVGALYVFYLPFEHWGYLRFMLSAAPIAFLFSAEAVAWIGSRFGSVVTASALAAVTILAVVRGVDFARSHNLLVNPAGDLRYVDGATYVDANTAPNAVILVMQHSGSVRYYSGRMILRYDILDPDWLDRAVALLQERGISTYALLEDWEEELFRKRFDGQRATRALDAGPLATRRSSGGELRFYAIRAPEARRGPTPTRMPRTSRGDCLPPSPRFAEPAMAFTADAVQRTRTSRHE
jgi:hypothetical protein